MTTPCPCGGKLRKEEAGLYACDDCGAEYRSGRNGLIPITKGVRPVDRPSAEDLEDVRKDIFSAQDHLPDDEYP